NSVDEFRPFGFGQTARPFDAAYRTESGKSRTRPKIPRMIPGINTQHPEAITLCHGCVLVRCQVQIRIVKIPEVSAPFRRSTCLFHDIFQTLARVCRDKPKLRSATGDQGGVDGTKSRILLGNPVERIKRNHEIKLVLEGQTTSVRHLKSKVGPRCRTEVALSEADHVTGRSDPDYGTSRGTRGDFRGDLS